MLIPTPPLPPEPQRGLIRNKDHGKQIGREINDDIETCRHHPACRHLIFFIYDPESLIPDQGALVRAVEVSGSTTMCLSTAT